MMLRQLLLLLRLLLGLLVDLMLGTRAWSGRAWLVLLLERRRHW